MFSEAVEDIFEGSVGVAFVLRREELDMVGCVLRLMLS